MDSILRITTHADIKCRTFFFEYDSTVIYEYDKIYIRFTYLYMIRPSFNIASLFQTFIPNVIPNAYSKRFSKCQCSGKFNIILIFLY